MNLERFDFKGLTANAQPPDEIISSDRYGPPDDEAPPRVLRCAVCGIQEHDATNLPVGYANPVCSACGELATDEAGDDAWVGWQPGDEPDPKPGTIQLAPDTGTNPVYVAGEKCWRRYNFGGYVTRRDAFDCDTIDEFEEKHRNGTVWIHAFNTPRPNGVAVSRERYESVSAQVTNLENAIERIEPFERSPLPSKDVSNVREPVRELSGVVQNRIPEPGDSHITEYARVVTRTLRSERDRSQEFLRLCERYYGDSL